MSDTPARDGSGTGGVDPRVDEGIAAIESGRRALLHELASMVDGTGRYIRLALEQLACGDADGALEALRVADEAMDTIGGLLGSRVIPVAEGTRALGDAVVHAVRNAQPTHHAIATAVSLHDPAASEAGVRLGLNMSPAVMSAGTLPVFPLVQNAIRNALEATASQGGGRIEVDASVVPAPALAQGECLLIMVVDDGPGVFLGSDDPFVLGVSTKETGGGVGLTICRDIAQSLGGRVSLGSVPPARPDHGWGTTCFSALLPIAPSNDEVLIGAEGNAGGSGG